MRTFIKKYNIQQFRKNCEAYILSFFRTQMRIKCFFTIFHTSLLSVRFSSIVISSCFQTLTLSSFRPLQQILNCLSLRFSQKKFFFSVTQTRTCFTLVYLQGTNSSTKLLKDLSQKIQQRRCHTISHRFARRRS